MLSWKFKTRSIRPIGLDIGHNSIKMIQLAINGGHISVLAADKVRIDPNVNGHSEERRSFVISAIKQMLAGSNFCRRDVISCLPNDSLKITSLRLAEAQEEEIERTLRKEVAQRFGLDPDTDTINYVLAGSVRQGDESKNEFILFAADNETIESHIRMLEQAQLRPVAIDIVPCALFRSFERSLRRQADRERTVVFVDVGNRFTTVVFGRGEEINFVKQIPIGGGKFNCRIAAKLGIDLEAAGMLRGALRLEKSIPFNGAAESTAAGGLMGHQNSDAHSSRSCALQQSQTPVPLDASTRQIIVDAVGAVAEELAREISLCFRYYTVTFRGKRVERAVFAGGEAYESILLNVLRRQLAVEVEVAQPLKGFDMADINFDSDKRGLLCEWAVAVGLGLKGYKSNGTGLGKGDDYERN